MIKVFPSGDTDQVAVSSAWEPAPGGVAGEYRSKAVHKNIRDVVGLFGDSNVGLQTYWYRMDLQAENEKWNPNPKTFVDPVYCGPGLWYDKLTGRVHVRLAHTKLALPASVTDLKPLEALPRLQSLCVLDGKSRLEDISPLAHLTTLESLYLHGTGVDDLQPLGELLALQALYLGATKVVDLAPVARLAGLRSLVLASTNVSDVIVTNGTPAQLDAFINGDPCLSDSRGKITERNCGRQPFTNIVDVKAAVGLPIRRANVELTFDVLNFMNLLNDSWGRYEFLDFQTLNSVAYRGVDATSGKAIYDIATIASPTFRKFTIDNLRSRWQGQFGLRVRF